MGVDKVSMDMIDSNPRKYLYPLWNRLASGSYFPPAVRECLIPKGDGKSRTLGIPTILDRVAQEVVRRELEPLLEVEFVDESYGYRPKRSAHDALVACERNCNERWYVLDLDIRGYFDNIDHEHLLSMIYERTHLRHHMLYCRRWLEAPLQRKNGSLQPRTKGTPQGGVISPLLANLYLHVVFDAWLKEFNPRIRFERYADDIVAHTVSLEQTNHLLFCVRKRFRMFGLELNEEKSRVVHCWRGVCPVKESADIAVSFDFLGYTFKPRLSKNTVDGTFFWGYQPGISVKSQSKIYAEINRLRMFRSTHITLGEIADTLALKLRGWIYYYGKFRKYEMATLFYQLNYKIVRWLRKKYKLSSLRRTKERLRKLIEFQPKLFYHWECGFMRV